MGNFTFRVPALGSKFVDYRDPIMGNSYTWHWVRPMSQVRYLVIHHAAAPRNQTPDNIARYHVQSLGWGGVGYHFIITQNGNVYYVGDLTTARAHVYNYNHLAIGICLTGSFMGSQKPTTAQIESTHQLCSQMLFRTPELPGTDDWEDVVPHKQLRATACPGDTWEEWRPQIITGTKPPDKTKRVKEVTQIYQVVLGREPDQGGLNHYINSAMTIDQIRKDIVESVEHRQIINKARNFKEAQKKASEALVHLSQAHQKIEEITKL